jgi:hypothetical protein
MTKCKYLVEYKNKGFYAVNYCNHPDTVSRGCILSECPVKEIRDKHTVIKRSLKDRR